MARIRYLKPDFFKDDDLAELPFWVRLLYEGLWIMSDKEGRLTDRPKRIKIEVFPYDKVDIEKGLTALSKPKTTSGKPYIVRYQIDSQKYIQVLNWHLHQRPHHTEKESTIPPYKGDITVGSALNNSEEPLGMGMGMGIEKGMGMGSKKGFADFEKSAIKSWNSFCDKNPILSKIIELSDNRRSKLKLRYKNKSFQDFDAILTAIDTQPFLLGENDRKWSVSFDWLIANNENYLKILEERYSNKSNSKLKPAKKDCKICEGNGMVYNESRNGMERCGCREVK